MIPPRVSLDNEREREKESQTLVSSSISNARWSPHTTYHASPVFPDGPTETGHTIGPLPLRARPEVGRGGTSRARYSRSLWAPYGLYMEAIHRECTICSFAVLSPLPRYMCTGVYPLFPRFPPILTVSLITGATRTARVISAYTRTPLFRAIGEQDEEHIGEPSATIFFFAIPFFSTEPQSYSDRKRICRKKTENFPGESYPSRVRDIFYFLD